MNQISIDIDRDTQPVCTHGYTIRTQDREMDVYVMSRPDGRPYLVLVGEPEFMRGWASWRGYEVWSLLDPDGSSGVRGRPTPQTPHETIVEAAVRRFLEEEERGARAA